MSTGQSCFHAHRTVLTSPRLNTITETEILFSRFFLALAAVEVVKIIIFGAVYDENFVKMITFPFQWNIRVSKIQPITQWSPLSDRYRSFCSGPSRWRIFTRKCICYRRCFCSVSSRWSISTISVWSISYNCQTQVCDRAHQLNLLVWKKNTRVAMNTWRPTQNGGQVAEGIFECILTLYVLNF